MWAPSLCIYTPGNRDSSSQIHTRSDKGSCVSGHENVAGLNISCVVLCSLLSHLVDDRHLYLTNENPEQIVSTGHHMTKSGSIPCLSTLFVSRDPAKLPDARTIIDQWLTLFKIKIMNTHRTLLHVCTMHDFGSTINARRTVFVLDL